MTPMPPDDSLARLEAAGPSIEGSVQQDHQQEESDVDIRNNH